MDLFAISPFCRFPFKLSLSVGKGPFPVKDSFPIDNKEP